MFLYKISIHPSTLCFISSQQQLSNLILFVPSSTRSLSSLAVLTGPSWLTCWWWVQPLSLLSPSLSLPLWHLMNYITYVKPLPAFVRSNEPQLCLLYPIVSFLYDELIFSSLCRFNRDLAIKNASSWTKLSSRLCHHHVHVYVRVFMRKRQFRACLYVFKTIRENINK